MRTVMIVDDERPARELLKMALDWQQAGYVIIAEAKNGKEAYEKYKQLQPQLIITDIQMPGLDGIELIEKIKAENAGQNFIILSCHESFPYAKRAMQLGVRDYLIKDSYSPTELYVLLKNLEANSMENQAVAFHDGVKEAKEQTRKYFVCVFSLAEFLGKNGGKREEVMQEITAIVNEEYDFQVELKNQNQVFLTAWFEGSNSILENINKRHFIMSGIKKKLEGCLGTELTIGCSNIYMGQGNCLKQCEDAVKALKYTVFTGKGKTIYFEGIQDSHKILEVDILQKNILHIQKSYEEGKLEQVEKGLHRIYEQDMQGMAQCHYLEYVNSVFYGYINHLLHFYHLDIERLLGQKILLFVELNNLNSTREMMDWVYDKLIRIRQLVEANITYSEHVKKAIFYIEKNYDEEIVIEDIAEFISIHKDYLSRVFKKETGMSVIKYLNQYRIKKAINLLDCTDKKISDIIYEVGYNNAQNFYYAFKQMTGLSPKEFKEKL